MQIFRVVFSLDKGDVGYCHVDHGCKFALRGLGFPNGIARGANETVYVVDSPGGLINVLELQEDNTLSFIDSIVLGLSHFLKLSSEVTYPHLRSIIG